MKLRLFCQVVTLMLALGFAQANELDSIKSNFRHILLGYAQSQDSIRADFVKIPPEKQMSDQAVVELHQRYPFDDNKLQGYLQAQLPDGTWPDINYADTRRSGWEPKIHTERALELAKVYKSKSSKFFGDPDVRRAIHSALAYWFSAKPKSLNWWNNEIGVPKTLGNLFILIEDELSPAEMSGAIEVMSAARFRMTGQNKVWLAGNILTRALLQNDSALVRQARDTIASEICLGRAEGIKPDWSFHQHGPQQQFGNYGLSFVSGMSFFARLFRGTSMSFDQAQMDILSNLINKGYRWVIWNRMMDVSSLGRQLFHNAQIHKGYALSFVAADLGIDGFARMGNTLTGHRHFFDSDFAVHRAKNWMCTVKMSSARVIGTERVNEDNIQGYYLGDGATYYYVDGTEYLNVFPFWDWRKIPGVTAYEDNGTPLPDIRKNKSRNRSAMVGGLEANGSGMAAMDFDRDGLKARKAWVMTDSIVVCLGAAIESDSTLAVTTSVDQRLRRRPLTRYNDGKWEKIEGKALCPPGLYHHDRTAYILTDSVIAESAVREGQWHSVMLLYTPETIEGEIVSLHLNHGVQPRGGRYVYAVVPDCTPEQAAKMAEKKPFTVLRNDGDAQVVDMGDGIWAAVYASGSVDLGDGRSFFAAQPGMYHLSKNLMIDKSNPFQL